jgi:hypothetical protein
MSGGVPYAAIAPQRRTKIVGFARVGRPPRWLRRSGLERLRRLAARYAAGVYIFPSLGIGVGVAPTGERR